VLFKDFSAAVFGIDAYLVEIEVGVRPGFQGAFNVSGLPDTAAKESREPSARRSGTAALIFLRATSSR
jgi:hypothetical protein